jgi:hypothetical protein
VPLGWKLSALAGAGYVVFQRVRRDLTGIGNMAREQERKRLRAIAVQIELAAEHPDAVRRLAKWLYESV